ncbi:substrate-binding domain-containing protein [Amycolatopsis sp. MtRt-6]|uniref:substrate-binding domain-containing protein n=1 Tax=Amycolatopsis sp. MtRt-6 TaxID=2792782 RepID=UPI001A8C8F17|nr:substrate-binding domain-containing protein [Amycolatopsis sp. MtRt-6]
MRNAQDSARTAVAEWTRGATSVTPVAAFNDLLALAVLASCRTRHIAVPDELALLAGPVAFQACLAKLVTQDPAVGVTGK